MVKTDPLKCSVDLEELKKRPFSLDLAKDIIFVKNYGLDSSGETVAISDPAKVKNKFNTLSAPQNLRILERSEDMVELRWDASSGKDIKYAVFAKLS